MHRLVELILGLNRDVLAQQGEYTLAFDPVWPGQAHVPAAVWNLVLMAIVLAWVVAVYRREGATRRFRVFAGALRLALLLMLLLVLNRPILSLTQARTEPSVLAVLVDDSLSMQVNDAPGETPDKPGSRLAAVQRLLSAEDGKLLAALAATHEVRLFRFAGAASPLGTVSLTGEVSATAQAAAAAKEIAAIKPTGQSTHVARAIQQVSAQLQGSRLAGVVVLSDGREMPATGDEGEQLRSAGVRVFAVPMGSEARVRNVAIRSVSTQDVAFKGDVVAVRVKVAVTGADARNPVTLRLLKSDGSVAEGVGSRLATATIDAQQDGVYDTDLLVRATQVGSMDLVVEAGALPGEITLDDNSRPVQISVLDAKVSLLYVEGYPRWEYRYLKTQMMRDKTVELSTLLTSADPGYAQEGSKPIRFFPQTMEQLMEYDVVLLGDVDPRQFTDAQVQMLREFVMKRGGGFGMIAGPRYAPYAWRGTPLEAVLPVDIANARPDETAVEPFRPVLTPEGQESPMFRFFADRAENERFVREGLQPLYWFARGVSARPAISEVYAEHPTITGPDGRKAPLVVVGRPGAGRVVFSAIDDTWRWRYYTGESIFDTYWVQQIRYLARGRKVGQRKLLFDSVQRVYEAGEQVQLEARVVDDVLASQLPDSLGVEVYDQAGKLVAKDNLQRQSPRREIFRTLLPASEVGRFTAKLPSVAAGVDAVQSTYDVVVPRLELSDPRPARSVLSQYAAETDGRVIEYDKAAAELKAIPSAARVVPVQTSWPLWSSPLLLGLLVILFTVVWVARKLVGLL